MPSGLCRHSLLVCLIMPLLFAFPAYLLLGLVSALVVLETCCELPQMRRLRQRFYREDVRELDSETTNIIDQEHMSDQLPDSVDHMTDHQTVISSVSVQAASMQRKLNSAPYTPASGSSINGVLK